MRLVVSLKGDAIRYEVLSRTGHVAARRAFATVSQGLRHCVAAPLVQVVPDLLTAQAACQRRCSAYRQCSFACAAQPLRTGVVTRLEAGPAARIGVACGKKLLESIALAQGIEVLEQPDQCRCTHLHRAVTARVVQAYQNRELAPGVRYA